MTKSKANLARQLAKDLRAYATIFSPPALGLTHQYRLSRAQAEALQKIMDRAAFVCEAHAEHVGQQEAPGAIQTDDERARYQHTGRPRKGRGPYADKEKALTLVRAL